MSKEWFILQFKANLHQKAIKNLNQQGFETFLPTYRTSSRKASRFTNDVRPLFSGYMFVAFDRENTNWRKINSTYGVKRLITFNSIIKAIPSVAVNDLMARCDLSGKLLPAKKLKKGDQVKILKGPFVDFFATVENYENDQRIWILMDLMSRKTKLQTSSEDIQLSN